MFAKILILALAVSANCQILRQYSTGLGAYGAGLGAYGMPVYRSSAHYGGLASANGWGYGANLGRVAGLGALRTTGSIIGGGALGYGSGALISGVPAFGVGQVVQPALAVAQPALAVAQPALAVAQQPALISQGIAPALAVGGAAYGPSLAAIGGLSSRAYGLGSLNVARGLSVQQAGPVNAAVITQSRTVDYRPVPYVGEPAVVQDIDVPPQESPLRINFQSKSSPLAVTQQHIPAEPGQVQVTQSEDEPQTAIHNVNRPVVQQVNELIQPYRTLTQTVEPVIEQTHTNIAQGEGVRLTGLTSGVVGGSGVLAASGVGVAGPIVAQPGLQTVVAAQPALQQVAVAQPALQQVVAASPAVSGWAASPAVSGWGLRTAGLAGAYGLGGLRTVGVGNAGLYSSGLYGSGLYGSGVSTYGTGLRTVGSGLWGGAGVYGARIASPSVYSTGYRQVGLGSGLALNGLSGLSTYGTTARLARF